MEKSTLSDHIFNVLVRYKLSCFYQREAQRFQSGTLCDTTFCLEDIKQTLFTCDNDRAATSYLHLTADDKAALARLYKRLGNESMYTNLRRWEMEKLFYTLEEQGYITGVKYLDPIGLTSESYHLFSFAINREVFESYYANRSWVKDDIREASSSVKGDVPGYLSFLQLQKRWTAATLNYYLNHPESFEESKQLGNTVMPYDVISFSDKGVLLYVLRMKNEVYNVRVTAKVRTEKGRRRAMINEARKLFNMYPEEVLSSIFGCSMNCALGTEALNDVSKQKNQNPSEGKVSRDLVTTKLDWSPINKERTVSAFTRALETAKYNKLRSDHTLYQMGLLRDLYLRHDTGSAFLDYVAEKLAEDVLDNLPKYTNDSRYDKLVAQILKL